MALDNYCELCDKHFMNPWNLNRHLKCHDEDWILKCGDCCHRTKRSDNLKEHKERYHPNKAFEPTRALETSDVTVAAKKSTDVSSNKPMEVDESTDFDLKLQLPNNFVYASSTQSGKTTLLMKTLENAHDIYNPAPSKVVFLYGCWQDIYNNLRDSLRSQGIKIEFKQEGIITKDDLEGMADPNGGQMMIVIDDNSIVASENKDVVDAFTKARHNNCSIVLLLHFIFRNQNLAKIRANTGYYFLLKSCENSQQVALLGSKMGLKSALVRAYEQEARKPYGYVLIDRCTVTPYQHRIRRNIFDELLGKQNEEYNEKEAHTTQTVMEEYEDPQLPEEPATSEPLLKKPRVWLEWPSKPKRERKAVSKAAPKKKKKPKRKAATMKPKSFVIEKPLMETIKQPWW